MRVSCMKNVTNFFFKDYIDGANIVTLVNVSIGVLAIYLVVVNATWASITLVFVAALLDHIDGYLARTYFSEHYERRAFGKQIDTLADVVNFNLAPAVIIIITLAGQVAALVASISLVLFGCIRLAHFNISNNEDGKSCTGLPTTYTGFLLINSIAWYLSGFISSLVLVIFAVFLSLLQVVNIPMSFPGTFICISILTVIFVANLIFCYIIS